MSAAVHTPSYTPVAVKAIFSLAAVAPVYDLVEEGAATTHPRTVSLCAPLCGADGAAVSEGLAGRCERVPAGRPRGNRLLVRARQHGGAPRPEAGECVVEGGGKVVLGGIVARRFVGRLRGGRPDLHPPVGATPCDREDGGGDDLGRRRLAGRVKRQSWSVFRLWSPPANSRSKLRGGLWLGGPRRPAGQRGRLAAACGLKPLWVMLSEVGTRRRWLSRTVEAVAPTRPCFLP